LDYPAAFVLAVLTTDRRPIQNQPNLHKPPLATVSSGNLPRVELPGNGVEALMAGRLYVPNDRPNIACELHR
jgi:hypothetical protein